MMDYIYHAAVQALRCMSVRQSVCSGSQRPRKKVAVILAFVPCRQALALESGLRTTWQVQYRALPCTVKVHGWTRLCHALINQERDPILTH